MGIVTLKKHWPNMSTCTTIPIEVYDESVNIETDIKYVLNKWSCEYESLFQEGQLLCITVTFDDFCLGL